jgi:hypothetical protein
MCPLSQHAIVSRFIILIRVMSHSIWVPEMIGMYDAIAGKRIFLLLSHHVPPLE